MRRAPRIRLFTIALTSLVALTMMASPALADLTFSEQTISGSDAVWEFSPDMSGRYIVWDRWNPGLSDYDVILCDRQTLEFSYPSDDAVADQKGARVSGDRVAWIDYAEADSEVYYDDLEDGADPVRLTTDGNDDVGVDIDGNYVVWMNGTTPGRQIRWYDIETDTYGTVPDTVLPNGVRVDRGRILYWDGRTPATWGVYVYDIVRDETLAITEVPSATTSIRGTAIHGDNVAWTQYANASPDDKNIFVADIRSGDSVQVTLDTHTQEYPSVFGDVLAWQDDRAGDYDIHAWWQPEPGEYQDVTASTANELYPAVYGHSVAYEISVMTPSEDHDIGLSVAALSAQRLAGDNRYETAAAISSDNFSAAGTVVLATGEDFPDALAASALAGAYNGPLLLTRASAIPDVVVDEIDRLGASNVVLVGGTSAIGTAVETQLDDLGLSHERVSGPNRYATAKQIAYRVMDMVNSSGSFCDEAFFVRGDDFADALSVAPHAYARRMPILLVKTEDVPSDTEEAIQFANITHGYVIGGAGAIANSTMTEITTLVGANVGNTGTTRWYGNTRYETALNCAWYGVHNGWLDWDTVGIATGQNFPDALGGGAACGAYGSPILLSPPASVPAAIDTFMTDHRYDFGGMEVYGGTSAIGAAVFDDFEGYLD